MSKMGCACGHVIRDQTDDLPYKATVLPDQRLHSFFEWVTEETQSYVEAALAHAVGDWLLAKGYKADYVALKLRHGEVLYDHIANKYRELSRDVYQCTACLRLYVQRSGTQRFVAFSPDDGEDAENVLAGSSP